MNRKFTLLIVICLSLAYTCKAQAILVLNILQVTIDGVDYSDAYIENEAYLMLYEENEELYFANVWQVAESVSYGEAIFHGQSNYIEPESGFEVDVYKFRWKYQNTYDDKTGSCLIELSLIHRPTAVAFELQMLQENAQVSVYKGYVEGTFDIKQYTK